ncbi:MAG: hypothetical protein KAG91_02895, partial [Mycoplasmataceae bacterium]|nr:hypothetical protein [Mycoplasmataceae bacterium]
MKSTNKPKRDKMSRKQVIKVATLSSLGLGVGAIATSTIGAAVLSTKTSDLITASRQREKQLKKQLRVMLKKNIDKTNAHLKLGQKPVTSDVLDNEDASVNEILGEIQNTLRAPSITDEERKALATSLPPRAAKDGLVLEGSTKADASASDQEKVDSFTVTNPGIFVNPNGLAIEDTYKINKDGGEYTVHIVTPNIEVADEDKSTSVVYFVELNGVISPAKHLDLHFQKSKDDLKVESMDASFEGLNKISSKSYGLNWDLGLSELEIIDKLTEMNWTHKNGAVVDSFKWLATDKDDKHRKASVTLTINDKTVTKEVDLWLNSTQSKHELNEMKLYQFTSLYETGFVYGAKISGAPSKVLSAAKLRELLVNAGVKHGNEDWSVEILPKTYFSHDSSDTASVRFRVHYGTAKSYAVTTTLHYQKSRVTVSHEKTDTRLHESAGSFIREIQAKLKTSGITAGDITKLSYNQLKTLLENWEWSHKDGVGVESVLVAQASNANAKDRRATVRLSLPLSSGFKKHLDITFDIHFDKSASQLAPSA